MSDDLAGVSDLELLARMRAGSNERVLGLWLIVPLVTLPVAILYGESAALAALLGSIAACAVLLRLGERAPRGRAAKLAEREYRRRYRLYELSEYEPEASAALQKPDAPEVVMLFSGIGLPEGTRHFVRVDLGERSRLQIRRALMPLDWMRADDPAAHLFRYDGPLSEEDIARVRRMLATLTAELVVPPNRMVFDGYPCAAVVLRRGAEPIWTNLDMANLPAELYQHPSAKLLRMFIELEAQVDSATSAA